MYFSSHAKESGPIPQSLKLLLIIGATFETNMDQIPEIHWKKLSSKDSSSLKFSPVLAAYDQKCCSHGYCHL